MAQAQRAPMMRMRLRFVTQRNFRFSEATLYAQIMAEMSGLRLSGSDVIAVVSRSEQQILFIHGFATVTDGGVKRHCLMSSRARLDGGRWDPLLLWKYAEDAGIELEGKAAFERYYRELTGSTEEEISTLTVKQETELATARQKKKAPRSGPVNAEAEEKRGRRFIF